MSSCFSFLILFFSRLHLASNSVAAALGLHSFAPHWPLLWSLHSSRIPLTQDEFYLRSGIVEGAAFSIGQTLIENEMLVFFSLSQTWVTVHCPCFPRDITLAIFSQAPLSPLLLQYFQASSSLSYTISGTPYFSLIWSIWHSFSNPCYREASLLLKSLLGFFSLKKESSPLIWKFHLSSIWKVIVVSSCFAYNFLSSQLHEQVKMSKKELSPGWLVRKASWRKWELGQIKGSLVFE